MEPHLPENEKKLFYKYLNKSKIYFEFGSGGSTYQAIIRENISKIYTVESDKIWLEKLKSNKIVNKNIGKVVFFYINMNTEPNTWGKPGKNSDINDWVKYSRAIHNLDKHIIQKIDLILIDGRFRVACVLNCLTVINENTVILFDDFLNREKYHIILDYFEIIESAGRMVVLKKKITLKKIISKYEKIKD